MRRKKPSKYRSFTFRCEYGRDDDVIKLLLACEPNERSEVIRTLLRQGNKMPLPPRPQTLDIATLRAELEDVANYILENIPAYTGELSPAPLIDTLRDVNEKGRNIPNF